MDEPVQQVERPCVARSRFYARRRCPVGSLLRRHRYDARCTVLAVHDGQLLLGERSGAVDRSTTDRSMGGGR